MFKTPGASLPWVERSCAPPSRARQSRWWLNLRSPAAPPPRCVSLSRRWNCRRCCWSAFECRHADRETCLWDKQLRARFGPSFIQSELTVYSVKGCLEEIPLTWILRVEKSQKLKLEKNIRWWGESWVWQGMPTSMTNRWSICFLARLGWKSEDSRHLYDVIWIMGTRNNC